MNMKKYIWMSVAALALASCSQNDELAQSGEGLATTHVVFTANVESGMKTRAVTDPTDVAPTRALLEIYDASGNLVGNQIPGELNAEGTAFTFSADLDGLKTYTCAFWADTEGTYNTESLKNISYKNVNNKQQGIAFTAKCDNINPSESKNVIVTLTHAVAKLVLHEDETGTGLKANDVVGVTFTRPNYTFDASSQTYAEDATATGTAIDLSYTVVSDGETGDLTAAYMLVPTSVVMNDVNLYFTTMEHSKTITNVPLKTNHRTLLSGAFENLATPAPSQTFNITCDTNWEGDSEKAFTAIVYSETHTIVLSKAGILTTTFIEQAVGTGSELKIEGPMNADDFAALKEYLTDNASTALLSDDANTGIALNLSKVKELTEIPDNALSGCTKLSSVQLSDEITRIGASAFNGCTNLTTVNMPQNLISMGTNAFLHSGLSGEIELPEGFTTLDPMSDYNPSMQFDYTNITALTLPESLGDITVNTIRCCFCNELTTVTFKSTVKELFNMAFNKSPKLTDVYMLGNATEAPIISDYLFDDKTKVTIHVPKGALSYFSDLVSAGYTVVEITE